MSTHKTTIIGAVLVLVVLIAGASYYFYAPTVVAPGTHNERSGTTPIPGEPSVSTNTPRPTGNTNPVISTGGGVGGQNVAPSLTTLDWTWQYTTHANGSRITPKDPSRFVLSLETDGKMHSTTDCNSISGTYTTQGNTIAFSPFMATMMFCSDGSQESLYSNDLSKTRSYALISNELHLTLNDGSVMVFSYHLGINE